MPIFVPQLKNTLVVTIKSGFLSPISMQVWEVHIWKLDPSTLEKGLVLASSKVTFLSNMPVPDNAREAGEKLKKFAKL